jgi:hypothetical protein
MQVSNNIQTSNNSTLSPLQNIMSNLKYDDKQVIKEALLKVPSQDLPKILNKLNKVPIDENYVNNLINEINKNSTQQTQIQTEGLNIYA